MIQTGELFDFSHTVGGCFLQKCTYPWEALPLIGDWIMAIGETLPPNRYRRPAADVWVAATARISPMATLTGPLIIGEESEVRQGAFLRGNVLIGDGCVVGNATELKNCILFDGVQVPHFNYIGDSVLGFKAHFGAGAVTSNVRGDKGEVTVRFLGESAPTGRKKVGAFVGDGGEIGCHAVLNPGCVLGKNVTVYPLTSVRGGVPEGHICKTNGEIAEKRR